VAVVVMMSDCFSMPDALDQRCFIRPATWRPPASSNSLLTWRASLDNPYQLTSLRTWLRHKSRAHAGVWLTASRAGLPRGRARRSAHRP